MMMVIADILLFSSISWWCHRILLCFPRRLKSTYKMRGRISRAISTAVYEEIKLNDVLQIFFRLFLEIQLFQLDQCLWICWEYHS
jgi:hypothetical protein